jgi:hypothetical protein
MLVQLVVLNQTPLDQWRSGVSIMLEKSAGNVQVSKLRAILLLEADFNALNKIVFNNRTLPSLEANGSIPYEIIGGRRGQSSLHVALNKKLVYDISNQQK